MPFFFFFKTRKLVGGAYFYELVCSQLDCCPRCPPTFAWGLWLNNEIRDVIMPYKYKPAYWLTWWHFYSWNKRSSLYDLAMYLSCIKKKSIKKHASHKKPSAFWGSCPTYNNIMSAVYSSCTHVSEGFYIADLQEQRLLCRKLNAVRVLFM